MQAVIEHVDPQAGVETNVCRFYRAVRRRSPSEVAPGEFAQTKWYDKGVGTNWYDRVAGGAFGLGLSRDIRAGYKFLSDTYEVGDEVFVFGFSRGAYTARGLVGMIRNRGPLPAGGSGDGPDSPVMLEAYELYRARDEGPDSEAAMAFRAKWKSPLIQIKCVGVWDTVGASGIPIESFNTFNKMAFEFHDVELCGLVKNAFHAVAVDEHREPYKVTLWAPKEKPRQVIEQRWFMGHMPMLVAGTKLGNYLISRSAGCWRRHAAAGCNLTRREYRKSWHRMSLALSRTRSRHFSAAHSVSSTNDSIVLSPKCRLGPSVLTGRSRHESPTTSHIDQRMMVWWRNRGSSE